MDEVLKLSIVIPVYKSPDSLNELYDRLITTISKITTSYEIIFVNDCSPLNDWEVILSLADKDKNVRGINLSRNFGQHYAITCGLDYSKGDWVIVMDCDLQDKPEEINKLYNKAMEGYNVVFGKRLLRKDKFVKRVLSKIFYKIYDYFIENETDSTVANFGIYNRKVVNSFKLMREENRVFPLFVKWLGFKTTYIDIEHSFRVYGKSSYNYSKLFNIAIDSIVAQSNKPLKLSIKFGFGISMFSFLYGIYVSIRTLIYNVPIGWTSIMVAIFFIGGLIFANLGLIGLYIGKIFNETKKRPLYVVENTVNIEY